MSTPMPRPMSNGFVEVRADRYEGAPHVEKRRWSDDFMARAVAAALEPGANISAIARSLKISPSQLFGWRRLARRGVVGRGCCDDVAKEGQADSDRLERVEIEIGDALVRVSADIREDDLRRLLRAVRQA